MQVHALIAQRVCHYPGEFAPELVDAVCSNTNDENPDHLTDAVDAVRKNTEEFVSYAVLLIDVDDDIVDLALNPVKVAAADVTVLSRSSDL